MMPPEPDRAWLRNAALLTTAGVILFAVLTVLFLNLISGSGSGAPVGAGDKAVPQASPVVEQRSADAEPATGTDAPEPGRAAPSTDERVEAGEAGAQAEGSDGGADLLPPERAEPAEGDGPATQGLGSDPESRVAPPPRVPSPTELEAYSDEQSGFGFQLPPGWRRARVEADLERDPLAADYDVVFESPEGDQRIAVSVWDAAERAAFGTWVLVAAGGMRAVDGQYPTNAYIAGEPALVVGEAESPTSPLRYAAFLAKGDRYVRIAWSAPTGAVRATDYLRTLATFQWPDPTPEGTVQGAGNQAPPLRLPAGLYFPSDSLFDP